MGRSKKPCPGCGEENTGRSANEVCYQCRQLLEEAKAARAWAKQETETAVFKIAYHYYSLPYIDHCKRDSIQRAFQEVIYAVGQPAIGNEHFHAKDLIEGSESGYGPEWARRVPVAFREHANRLYQEIQKATAAAYQEGYKDGQNLIVQLARGEVSLNEFREETGEKPRRRR